MEPDFGSEALERLAASWNCSLDEARKRVETMHERLNRPKPFDVRDIPMQVTGGN